MGSVVLGNIPVQTKKQKRKKEKEKKKTPDDHESSDCAEVFSPFFLSKQKEGIGYNPLRFDNVILKRRAVKFQSGRKSEILRTRASWRIELTAPFFLVAISAAFIVIFYFWCIQKHECNLPSNFLQSDTPLDSISM